MPPQTLCILRHGDGGSFRFEGPEAPRLAREMARSLRAPGAYPRELGDQTILTYQLTHVETVQGDEQWSE